VNGRGAYQKRAQNLLNVHARHQFLIEGITVPSRVNNLVHKSLTGQRAFAALDVPSLKISPISLNTLKSVADEIFTNPDENNRTGFAYLDALRIRLGEAVATVAATRTKEAKAERIESKNNFHMARLTSVEIQSIRRQKAYFSLYAAINGLIRHGGLPADVQARLYKILENHHAAFSSLFAPNADGISVSDANVTNLYEMDRSE